MVHMSSGRHPDRREQLSTSIGLKLHHLVPTVDHEHKRPDLELVSEQRRK